MLEKVNHLAEQAAINISRRQFFGRLGRAAAASAAALAGFLAASGDARAGRKAPQRCGPLSSSSCAGKYVGAFCFNEALGAGKCASTDKKDKSQEVICVCHVKRKGPRR